MIEKIKKNITNNKWIYITFLISTIIISVIYMLSKIAPFGNNSMLDVDFYHQYGPLLNELYDRVKEGSSLLYSFNTGGGLPFYRNFLNYLSSPFNIVLFLFKKENIVMAFSCIIGLKVIFASGMMSIYLKKTFKKDGVLLTVFSVLYAFSGYFCSYYWNIMWLDGMVFLPLIMLGINKLVDDEKPIFYTIFLSIMLIANYFIAYMICIFTVMYFFGYLFYRYGFSLKKTYKKIILFILFSILAAALVSFALIPLYKALSSISATSDSFPELTLQFKFHELLFNHLTGVNRTVFASDELPLPNVYAGLLTFTGVILFFINKKINIRAKLLAFLILLIFVLSFNINSLDFIWHAFHVPNDLPWRYSFIYVFIFITIGYYGILRIKDLKKSSVFASSFISLIIILLAYKFSFKNIDFDRTIINIIFVLLYLLIFLFTQFKKINKKIIYALIIIFVSAECIYGIDYNWNIDHDIATFMSDKNTYEKLISETTSKDNDLYRMEKTDYLTLNDAAWYNYKGISTFTSMAYESVSKFQRKLGLSGNNINSYYYKYYNTPIYNTMFDIKYLMGSYIENPYYSYLKTDGKVDLIKYNYSSSLLYGVDKKIKGYYPEEYNPFKNQSDLVSLTTNTTDIYTDVLVKDVIGGEITPSDFKNNSNGEFNYILDDGQDSITFMLDNKVNQNIYLYINGSNVNGFEVDDKYYSITSDEYYTVDVGTKEIDDVKVKINFKDNNDDGIIKFYAYAIDDDKFKEFYNEINKNILKVTSYSDTLIEGDVTLKSDKVMLSTIAYDIGWKVYVDGKSVDTYKIADSYLAFDIKKGSHKIKLVYYPDGMKLGVITSFISLAIIFIYAIFSDKSKKIKKR